MSQALSFASPYRCQQPWLLLLSVSWETNLDCTDHCFTKTLHLHHRAEISFRVIPLYLPESQLWGRGPRSLKSLGPQDHPLNFHSAFCYAWTSWSSDFWENNKYQWLVSSHPSKVLLTMCACSVLSNPVTPYTITHKARCPWDSPGENTGVSCHFLLQGIFLTQRWNSHLLHLLH